MESEPQPTSNTPTREEFEELKSLTKEIAATEKQNNKILRNMRFWNRVSFWFKAALWIIVLIGIPVLISVFFPFLNSLFHGALSSFGGTASSTTLFGYPSPTALEHAFGQ